MRERHNMAIEDFSLCKRIKRRTLLYNKFGNDMAKMVTFNVILAGACIIGGIELIASLIVGSSLLHKLLILCTELVGALVFYIANYRGKLELALRIAIVLVVGFLFPALFVTGGGLQSGMCFWFTIGITFTLLLLRGKECLVFVILEVIVDAVVIVATVTYPQIVTYIPTQRGVIFNTIVSMVATATCIGLLLKHQTWQYESVIEKSEEQRIKMELLKQEAEKANATKGDFLANMSHEIRTPLNAVIGMSRIALREDMSDEVRAELNDILKSSESLMTIINDILDFSKIEAGQTEIVEEEYRFSSLLHDVVTVIDFRLLDKAVSFVQDIDGTLPDVLCGDENRIKQILLNILGNAAKFTDTGSIHLKVDWEKRQDQAFITYRISDTGSGIRPEEQKNVFKRFQRLDMRKDRRREGAGLGMPIARELARLMHGDITFESVWGEGTTFIFTVPQKIVNEDALYKERKYEQQEQKKSELTVMYPKASVLVVDDNHMNLKVEKGLLEPYKIDLDFANSGKECLEKTSERIFDLIFLDHMMPEMDGVETLRRMQENKKFKTPVIALTANAMSGVSQVYKNLGFTDYLSKPIKEKDMEHILETYLSPFKEEVSLQEPIKEKQKSIENIGNPIDMTEMNSFEQLDISLGMEYAKHKKDFYIDTMEIYLEETMDSELKMKEFLEEEDMHNYAILVHALKSNSRLVGAADFGDFAERMERYSKAGDIQFVKEHHYELMDQLEKVRIEIRAYLKFQKGS